MERVGVDGREVEEALHDPRLEAVDLEHDPELRLLVQWFKHRFGKGLLAVIFMGSCLSELTKSEDSFRDFFCILESYKYAHNVFKRWFHRILPPELYHLALPLPGGREVHCKYYILSLEDLIRTTGPRAPDLYVLGRLSKRVAVVYARDQEAREEVNKALASAASQAVRRAAALVDRPMSEEEFYKLVLQISYLGERRLEDERKIEALFQAGEAYYRKVYGKLVSRLLYEGCLQRLEDGRLLADYDHPGVDKEAVEAFIRRSRRRAMLRWPKMMITVDNWVDQLLAKLERTHGIKLEIPAWERPFILITGWRHFFRLWRQGKVR